MDDILHPAQRALVERSFAGQARVSGSAGTGKTIVALHRAVFLTQSNPDTRVLLTTFSDALANALRTKLRRLVSGEPQLGDRIEVCAIDEIGRRLYERNVGPVILASRDDVRAIVGDAAAVQAESRFSPAFLLAEWEQVVDAWQLDSWEALSRRGATRPEDPPN